MKSKKYYIKKCEYGKELSVTDTLDDNLMETISKVDFQVLHLNSARGCYIPDLNILKKIPSFVKGIDIIALPFDFTKIYFLKDLVYLNIYSYLKNPVDFTNFPNLNHVFLIYWPKADSIFKCKKLKKLYVYGFKEKNAKKFEELKGLEVLKISSTPMNDISQLGKLTNLKMLGLYVFRKLDNLNGVEKLINLETLDIESCRKINNLSIVAELKNLRNLYFEDCGEIESLQPIKQLHHLEKLLFGGNTKILDGNIDFLRNMKFKLVTFANRRHYSLKNEELEGHPE